ncbi:helix-turn-helix domain-containing protein [Chryseobacterium lathyri]|uniref:helix-turn-helix domain-containing protein n=1 Tax=Chryseobacterium lathyri TaxID=395933 RepID=UPI002788125B|nr:helix-turn-helix transcriptional regulator [Chryseobacterium lathyri]MDQ0066030.1 transcriptional regulator with XRE-family HTH domain [Chryseobacterium lathyri]
MKIIDENKITELKARIPVDVGNQIRKFREKKKLSQTELAELIGKDRQYLYKIEKGKVTSNVFTIALIASALDISLSDLVEEIKL